MKTKLPAPRARKKLFAAAALAACACLLAYALASTKARAQDEEEQEGAGPAHAERIEKDEPKVAVYGRAVFEGTNRPVRRAQVMLFAERAGAGEHAALTDAEGRFRIKRVPPGRYIAFVSMSGVLSPVSFVGWEELRAGGGDFTRPELKGFFDEFEVDGEADKEVTVYARRGAAVSGKVTYQNGDPAVGVRVHIMRHREKRLSRFVPGWSPSSFFNMTTDDRGVYRLAGLPPGEYVVGVSETADHGNEGQAEPGSGLGAHTESYLFTAVTGEPLLMTYHPSTPRAADAAVVKVEAGDERDDVDVTIFERELRELAGVVRGRRDRRPVRNVEVFLVPGQGEAGAPPPVAVYGQTPHPNVKTDEEGRWRLKDIPDGQYTLHFVPPEGVEAEAAAFTNRNLNGNVAGHADGFRPPRRRKSYAPASRELRVASDVQELVTELGDGARVAGSITVEDGKPPEYGGVILTPAGPGARRFTSGQMPNATAYGGEFAVEGVAPGSYYLNPHVVRDTNPDLYLKSITWKGRDLLREPLEVADGEQVEGVRVVFARGTARLRLRVLAQEDGRPAAAVFVLLVPPDASGQPSFRRMRQCTTETDGTCEIVAAPGDYALVAYPWTRGVRPADFEADLTRRVAAAPRLTLHASETKTHELTVAAGN